MVNTFKGNRLIYTPGTNSINDITTKYRPKAAIKDKQCGWWSEDPLFSYNAMLISAYYGMDTIEDRSKIRDDVLFLGDSGGFQVLKNKLDPTKNVEVCKKLTPEKVIQWQMKVCDIGMTLDIPTPRAWIQIDNKKIFEERLEESKKNALIMLDYKNKHKDEMLNPDFKLFNCIHGVYLDQMERWYKETTGYNKATDKFDVEYDGFAFSTSKVMKYLLALRLGFAIEHSRGKPFHLLGVSSPSSLALIAYANKYTKTQIYFDSTSAANGMMLRKYMLFWNLTGSGVSLKEDRKYEKYHSLECPCPVCTQLERPEDLWELGTTSGILITLHNLFWMTNYTAFINNLVHYEDEFKAFVRWLTHEPGDNPYQQPKGIKKYVAGVALEQDDTYDISIDLNLSDLVKNGIPLTAPLIENREYKNEITRMTKRSDHTSWVLEHIDFLDLVNERGLETAWKQHFIRHKSTTSVEFDPSNTEEQNITLRKLCAERNSKAQNSKNYGNLEGKKAYKEARRREMLNPKTREEVKVGELVDEALTEVSKTSKNHK